MDYLDGINSEVKMNNENMMDVLQPVQEKLKATVLGGYEKKSVDNLIKNMQENLFRIKEQMEQQVRDIANEKFNTARECEVLRDQLSEAETNLQSMHEKIEEYRENEMESIKNNTELEDYKSEVKRLRSLVKDYGDMKSAKEMYESRLEEQENYIKKLNEDAQHYRDEFDKLQEKMQALQEELDERKNDDSLKSISEEHEKREAQLIKRCEELEERCKQLELELNNSKEERSKYLSRVRELSDENQSLQDKIRSEYDEIEKIYAQLQEGIESNQSIKEELNNQQVMLSKERRALEERIDTERNNYHKSLEKISVLENENSILKQERKKTDTVVSELKDALKRIFGYMEKQSDRLRSYAEKLDSEKEKNNNNLSELTRIKQTNAELANALNTITARYEDVLKENQRLEDILREMDASLGDYSIGDSDAKDSEYENAKDLVLRFSLENVGDRDEMS